MRKGVDEKYTVIIDGNENTKRASIEIGIEGTFLFPMAFNKSIQIVGLEDETVSLPIVISKDPYGGEPIKINQKIELKEKESDYILIDWEEE